MLEKLTQPLNKLTEVEFEKRYGEIISSGVVAVEQHIQTGSETGEQAVVAAIGILYQENPGHHLSLITRQMLELED